MARQDQLDTATLALVRLAAAVAQGDKQDLREAVAACRADEVPVAWVEELLLQSLLIVGYPRTLVALAVWRRIGRVAAPSNDAEASYRHTTTWTTRGEATCRAVYGDNYDKLRQHVRGLHPAVDAWMSTEGYGRTMSRPDLDLLRRELCTVAQTAVLETPRQLHSHLRGALNAGASPGQVDAALSVVNPLLSFEQWKTVKELWGAIRDDRGADRTDSR
jgi:4-carboxymuconolactone decarboxylase